MYKLNSSFKLSKYLQKYYNKNNNNNNIIFLKIYFIYLSYKNKNSMGNYFSRQNKESIEIINEIDHVHVIVSNSDKKNESGTVNNQTVQDSQDSQDSQCNQDNQGNQCNVLNDHEKKPASIELDTNNQDKNNNSQIDFNKYNDIICKKNLKKRKCKKNKKKHLQ
jgi:hypothetical protein